MSFALLHDDEETFTELLALVDEYNAAIDETLQSNHPRANHSSAFRFVSESAAWAAFEAAHPIPHTTSKHRNGARESRRREVQFLRTCVNGLETELKALNEAAEQRTQLRMATAGLDNPIVSSAVISVWKDLAMRQLDQRLDSERENSRLRGALEDQKKLRELLQRALNTRVARRVMETSFAHEKSTRRVHGVALEVSDQEIFQELEAGVDSVYQEAARTLFQTDTGHGTSLGVFEEKILPFNLNATAEAAWRCLAHTFQHEKYTFSYTRERRKDGSSEVINNNTVGESFGVEIKVAEKVADFRIKQVFRRYVESDRVVIAWRSYIDPAEFKDQKMRYRFQEKGSMVIQQPPNVPMAGNELAMLRIWHMITPEMLAHTNDISSQFVRDLTDFVVNGSSSASTVQMIENMLLEQSGRSKMEDAV